MRYFSHSWLHWFNTLVTNDRWRWWLVIRISFKIDDDDDDQIDNLIWMKIKFTYKCRLIYCIIIIIVIINRWCCCRGYYRRSCRRRRLTQRVSRWKKTMIIFFSLPFRWAAQCYCVCVCVYVALFELFFFIKKKNFIQKKNRVN